MKHRRKFLNLFQNLICCLILNNMYLGPLSIDNDYYEPHENETVQRLSEAYRREQGIKIPDYLHQVRDALDHHFSKSPQCPQAQAIWQEEADKQ